MAEHIALLVETKRHADGALALCVACCGLVGPTIEDMSQEDTRSWHVIYAADRLSEAELTAKIEEHKAAKERQHGGMEKAHAHTQKLLAADAARLAELRLAAGAKGGAKILPNKGALLPLNSASTPK